MSVIQGNSHSGSDYSIANSLRLRASASAYLSRTTASAGNRTSMTYSGWVKRGILGGDRALLSSTSTGGAGYETSILRFTSTDQLRFSHTNNAGAAVVQFDTTAVFRDTSAWYHVVLQIDTTQAVNASGVKLYVNGVLQAGSFAAYTQNAQIWWTSSLRALQIGYTDAVSAYFDGYVSEVNFVDGQALDPNSFGNVDAATGQWVPKKYTGAYGTNGFYLPFNDGTNLTNLCLDRSGNGNNWTAAGVSLTTGATYDWMLDTPTNNHAVLNAIYAGRSSLSNGNLTASGTTDLPTIIPESGSGTWYFERDGVSQTWTPPAAFPAGTGDYNFGQRPWLSTGPTAGQKVLRISDLPTPTIANPKQHFDVVLATGANVKTTSEAVFPSNFFEWIKDRANVNNHQLIDTVRGSSAVLQSNTTGAETTYSVPSGSSVGWVWKAGGAAVSNTAGSIASQVSANTTAGFSVVTYTGTGTNATVGHGLGVAPKMVIIKNRGSIGTAEWLVGHSSIGFDNFLLLNSTQALATAANRFNNTSPTSSVFSIGTIPSANTETYVAYCFAEVPGFSKIGSYIGNGSSDGPFVYCGFKPRFVMVKRTDTISNWFVVDTVRGPYNLPVGRLLPNLSNAEDTNSTDEPDILSNGFKLRGSGANANASGGTYIFYAVAESPFNYSTAR